MKKPGAAQRIGQNIQVTVQRFHHTAQGRMIFAELN